MRALLSLALVGGVFATAPAMAQEVQLSYGVAANLATSDGDTSFTVEGEVGATYMGFTAGIWIGSLYQDVDDFEMELSLGYGTTIGTADVSLTYTAYFLETDYDTQDIELALAFPVSDRVALGTAVAYDLDNELWDISAGVEVVAMDKLALHALIGDDGTGTYWEAGATYELPNNAFVGLLYEDSDYDVETVTLSVGFAF